MIVAVPTDDKKVVSTIFGKAAWFALFDDAGGCLQYIRGLPGAETDAGLGAVTLLAEHGVTELHAADVGMKAGEALIAAGISTMLVRAGTPLQEASRCTI
ncbi:MAG: hypothetical protein JXM71_05995 [Spirochaetales bacterium]|nr:hypothetical protein [Spirochaetales bacterium]